jgi:hypothetical protein
MLNFERFTKVRFYILFPELSNSACLPGIAGGLTRLISLKLRLLGFVSDLLKIQYMIHLGLGEAN